MPASGKILNTNMGLGFQRGRKYDTDLDRLGRMKTAQSELRKTGELNLQKELKKSMATYSYRVKRFSAIRKKQKEYGLMSSIGEGVSTAAGGALETGGKLLDNGVSKTIGGGVGMMKGAALGGSILGIPGAILGGLGGAVLGSGLTGAAGKGLKAAGQELKS